MLVHNKKIANMEEAATELDKKTINRFEEEEEEIDSDSHCNMCDASVKPWKRGLGTLECPFILQKGLCENCADPYNSEEATKVFRWVERGK